MPLDRFIVANGCNFFSCFTGATCTGDDRILNDQRFRADERDEIGGGLTQKAYVPY